MYAKLNYPDQAAYPGQEEFESWAEPLCYGRFESYTGIGYEESSLDFGYLYPGTQGWAAGDQEVICYLFDPAGDDLTSPIDTGSARPDRVQSPHRRGQGPAPVRDRETSAGGFAALARRRPVGPSS